VRSPFRSQAGAGQQVGGSGISGLLLGAAKLVAVVALAGAAGTLLGVGLSKVSGDDGTAASEVATSRPPALTGASLSRPPAQTSGGKLRVDVFATIVHPIAGDAARRANLSAHVRIVNNGTRVIRPQAPLLLVDDVHVPSDAGASSAAALTAPIAIGGVADGRLSFQTRGAVTQRLTTGRVRLRVAGKTLVLTPEVGSATGR
jgi:hypothetical protein